MKTETYIDFKKKLGEKFKSKRSLCNLSQQQVAYKLKVDVRRYKKWESGENLPDVYMLVKIADIFKVDDLKKFIDPESESVPNQATNKITTVITKLTELLNNLQQN